MRWIETITRENSKLVAATIDDAGMRSTCPLHELGDHRPKFDGRSHKSKLDTDFQDWRLASTDDYLCGLGLSISADDSHRVFRFEYQELTYLIPAIVLFKAIFRPLNWMSAHLFRPQGLEQACVPTLGVLGVHFVTYGLSQRVQSSATLQQPLSWLWCFPSAKRMWDSVYKYAYDGLLACDLPLGNARIVVTGVKNNKLFFVSEMTVLQITASEEPFKFARGHTKTIVFHEGVLFRMKQQSEFVARADDTLRQINGQWELTDPEWCAIHKIFFEQERRGIAKRKHEIRTLIDGIIAKLGTGTPWTKFEFKTGTSSNACKLYGECRKDGRWAQIQAILNESRATPV